jgi:hypothetical protein
MAVVLVVVPAAAVAVVAAVVVAAAPVAQPPVRALKPLDRSWSTRNAEAADLQPFRVVLFSPAEDSAFSTFSRNIHQCSTL